MEKISFGLMVHRHTEIWKWQRNASGSPLSKIDAVIALNWFQLSKGCSGLFKT